MKKFLWPILLLGTLVLGVVIYKSRNSPSTSSPVTEEQEGKVEFPEPSSEVVPPGVSGGPLAEGVVPPPTTTGTPPPSFQPYQPGYTMPSPEGYYPQTPPPMGENGYPKGDPYIPPPPPGQGYEPPLEYPDPADSLPPPSFGDSLDDENVPSATSIPPVDDEF